jgi:hypothetical protein
MHDHSAQNAGHRTAVQYYVGRQGGRAQDGRVQYVGQQYGGHQGVGRRTNVGRKSNECRMSRAQSPLL